MPLLPVSDLEKWSPLFRGTLGNAFARFVRKTLSVETLSNLSDKVCDLKGAAYAEAMLEQLNQDFLIGYPDRLLSLPEGPFITVSNHPYGGLDGVILLDLIGNIRPDLKVMVNEFLNVIEPLSSSWIPVNPKDNLQKGVTEKNIRGVKTVLHHLADGHPVGFFPSGAVSDLKLKDMSIRDREWQEPVLRLIRKARVPIVPVRFFDHNSLWFYSLGLINWKIRLLQLPREIINKKHRTIRVGIGETITVEEQQAHPEGDDFNRWLREKVYGMQIPEKLEYYSRFRARTRD